MVETTVPIKTPFLIMILWTITKTIGTAPIKIHKF